MDSLGHEEISFKDLIIDIAVLMSCSKDMVAFFGMAFELFDYEDKLLLERSELVRIFRNLNLLLDNFGDKNLNDSQLQDLINSVFTINGKIDGCICYKDYITTIVEHPITQLSLCMQYQGSGREKLKELLS